MTVENLKKVLASAAAQLKPGHALYPSLFEDDGVTPRKFLPNWLIDPIRQEVETVSALGSLNSGWLQTPGSGHRLSPHHVAQALAHRLFQGLQPADVVADILCFAAAKQCPVVICIGLYGHGVDKRIELAEGVEAMPAGDAPATFGRELLFGIDRWERPVWDRAGFHRRWPTIALLVSSQMDVFSEGLDTFHLKEAAIKADRAIRSLTLASDFAFVRGWQTSWVAHPAVPYEGFGGQSGAGTFLAPPHPRQGQSVNSEIARSVYATLATLKPEVARPVELAVDRLGRSRAHPPSADTAMDLGIASEIILLHDMREQGELSYQFALRGAYLLASEKSERSTRFEGLRALYRARSQAVHSGQLKKDLMGRLPEFDSLCCAAIRAVINARKFPDWRKLTLGLEET